MHRRKLSTAKSAFNLNKTNVVNGQEDFRTMHLMPLVMDMLSPFKAADSPNLRPNSLKKPYPDIDTYLETHIRLLWADYIDPLRETIGVFCKGTQQAPVNNKRIHCYHNVVFTTKLIFFENGVPDRPESWRRFNVRFDSTSNVDWEKSKRLIYGALVVLWNAARRLIIIATVTGSDEDDLKRGKITLSIENVPENCPDFTSLTYSMLESESFYEPYRVAMGVYQKLQEDTFPFKEHLLGWDKAPGVATYLTTKASRNNYRISTGSGKIVTIKDVLRITSWPSPSDLGVNPIQRTALHAALTRRLALIQGPPGTGKTFIGRKIISTLLLNKHLWHDDGNFEQDNARLVPYMSMTPGKMGGFWRSYGELWRDERSPIVVICLTNQALDQFLEGVLKFTKRVIRIGSQSQSEELESYTLSVTRENIIENKKTYKDSAFLYHLQRMKKMRRVTISDAYDDLKCLLKKLRYQMNLEQRNVVAESAIKLQIDYQEQIIRSLIEEYNFMRAQSEEALCRTVDVIGFTTTGAARRRKMLELLKPKIIVVEEAAQVLEPYIVSSLVNSCQHLIMIGDHLQLRPICVHKLATKYHMDVSLFERLVKNGVPAVTLGIQHRMRPEISRLLVPSVYSKLEDHDSVSRRPPVPSFQRNVFFLDHDHEEEREEDGCSYFNSHEAVMALRLAHFLCEQGVEQHQITVLATYAAQVRALNIRRKNQYTLRSLDRVHITTVDNYQGEENDIVILSLVRNNKVGNVGFLRTPNRVCVALSRARQGLFILGNIRILSKSKSKLWMHVRDVLSKNGEVGSELTVRCDRHSDQIRKIKNPQDFPIYGIICSLKCDAKLDCGHLCQLTCRNKCHHGIAMCQQKVQVELPCTHKIQISCSAKKTMDVQTTKCSSTRCLKTLSCGHRCPLKCADRCDDAKCTVEVELTKVSNKRKCGHPLRGPCHLRDQKTVDLKQIQNADDCQESCLNSLRCGHRCSGQCGKCVSSGVHDTCKEPCKRTLLCGHSCPAKCGEVCPPCRKPCQARCLHRSCIRLCGEECTLCEDQCPWQCVHLKCNHPCFEFCNRDACSLPCTKTLSCGHPCPGLCGEVCPPATACIACLNPELLEKDNARFVYLRDCGHNVPVAEMDQRVGYEMASKEKIQVLSCPQCQRKIRFCFGRYADYVKSFYEDLCTARSIYDDESAVLSKKIKSLLTHPKVKDGSTDLTSITETLLKGKGVEELWRLYQRTYFLFISSIFKSELERTFTYTTVNKKSAKVKLTKVSAAKLLSSHDAIMDRLVDSSVLFTSAECATDGLAQWRRLDLLRQCLTMESAPSSNSSKTCHKLLNSAKVLLDDQANWTLRKESSVLSVLKSAATLMDFEWDDPSIPEYCDSVSMCSDDWAICSICESVYSTVRFNSCPACVLPMQNLVL